MPQFLEARSSSPQTVSRPPPRSRCAVFSVYIGPDRPPPFFPFLVEPSRIFDVFFFAVDTPFLALGDTRSGDLLGQLLRFSWKRFGAPPPPKQRWIDQLSCRTTRRRLPYFVALFFFLQSVRILSFSKPFFQRGFPLLIGVRQ